MMTWIHFPVNTVALEALTQRQTRNTQTMDTFRHLSGSKFSTACPKHSEEAWNSYDYKDRLCLSTIHKKGEQGTQWGLFRDEATGVRYTFHLSPFFQQKQY